MSPIRAAVPWDPGTAVELHAWTPSAPEHDTVEYLDRLFGCARETVR
jgi:hypothetical protein